MRTIRLFIRLCLFPFALLYGLLGELRNFLFDCKVLPIYKTNIPVISVGNISVGGTGKTPFTIWLVQKLTPHFKRIVVVSRGYGRKSKGLKVVSEKGKILCDVQTSGDEPMLIARKAKQALVIVSEKREKALRHIEITQEADLIILDDAFQHRWVARDVDVVLLKNKKSFLENLPLPTGNLREFYWRLKRADFLIFTDRNSLSGYSTFVPEENQFKSHFELGNLVDESFKTIGSVEVITNKKVAAFAGIAHPNSFFEMLKTKGVTVVKSFSFRDHYHYREADLEKMLKTCRQFNVKWLLCTEKDLVKIQDLLPVMDAEIKIASVNLAAVGLQMHFDAEKEFITRLLKRLTK